MPGGYGGSVGYFDTAGGNGYWWSATEDNANYAWYRYMNYYGEYVVRYGNDEAFLFSVRCVQDKRKEAQK